MYRIFGTITLIALLIGGCSSKAPAPTWKHISVDDNQLKNPSFELVGGKRKPSFWSSEWTRTWSNGAYSGKQFLRHPWASGETTTKQLFSLKKRGFNLADIDKGLYKIRFGGFQKGTSNENEKGEISLAFFDINQKFILNKSIEKINIGLEWKKREKIVQVPKNTRYIQYNFTVYKPKSTQRSKGPYVDDTYVYLSKGNMEQMVVPKVEIKKTSISSNEDISSVAYVQGSTVFYKNLKSDEMIFEREYKCKNEIGKGKPLVSIKNNILHISSCWGYKNSVSFGNTDLIHSNKKIKDVKVKHKAYPITSEFYGLYKDNTYEIYDFKNQKLLYSFELHSKTTLNNFIDRKSNKIVFYETTVAPFSDYRGNDFLVNNIYVLNMKSKKGKKVSLAKKGKKYNSIFPVGFFVATDKNNNKIFYQISAQSKELDRIAIAAKNKFKAQEWDIYGNLYPSAIQKYGPTEINFQGINLSTMKYEKLNTKYMFNSLELNRVIDINHLYKGSIATKPNPQPIQHWISKSIYSKLAKATNTVSQNKPNISKNNLPKSFQKSRYWIVSYTKEKVLLANDKEYTVINFKNKGEK
ncbi:MAG: hypothetical protein DRG78_07685 [Epsilonproteobacteria bacterium]|nr:MAG: hypothetical protein DRG78_07685 [Campylobacterota bacterium]